MERANEYRQRLLEAIASCVAHKGYPDTTISDIAAKAKVSKRTFYEHFNSKSECLIALYETGSHNALSVLKQSLDPNHDWHTQVEKALRAYFQCLAQNPVLMRTLFIEMLGLGTEGLAARRRTNSDLANCVLQMANGEFAQHQTPQRRLSEPLAIALVGGLNEWVLQAIEDDRLDRLEELVQPAAQLVRAVIDGHP